MTDKMEPVAFLIRAENWGAELAFPQAADQMKKRIEKALSRQVIYEPLYTADQVKELTERLEEAEAQNDERRAKLGFLDDLSEVCGMSWNGFNIKGDRKSIKEVSRLENRSSQLEVYRAAYDERIATAEAALAEARKVIEPLRARADKWANNTDSARVSVRLGDLRALAAWLSSNEGVGAYIAANAFNPDE
jgi:uncharacterized coiled-coil protein SlyX